jgi:hypothetical protein
LEHHAIHANATTCCLKDVSMMPDKSGVQP